MFAPYIAVLCPPEFFKDEEGAAMVEYALLLGLIAIAAITAVTLLGHQVSSAFTYVAGQMPHT